MSNSAVLGPVTLEAKIHCVNPSDGSAAVVTYGLPPGQPVDPDAIERALHTAAEAVAEHGYVLMAPDTFFNHVIVKDKTGRVGNFATPASFQYDAFGMETADIERSESFDEDDEDED